MPAYLKLGDLEGDSDQVDHKKWIQIKSVSHPVTRSIRSGAKGVERSQGSTVVGDVHILKFADRATPKLAEACAGGKYFKDAIIDMCNVINKKVVKFYTMTLSNVVVSSYSFHGTEDSQPPATEEITLNFTKIAWEYNINDKETGESKGKVPAEHTTEHTT